MDTNRPGNSDLQQKLGRCYSDIDALLRDRAEMLKVISELSNLVSSKSATPVQIVNDPSNVIATYKVERDQAYRERDYAVDTLKFARKERDVWRDRCQQLEKKQRSDAEQRDLTALVWKLEKDLADAQESRDVWEIRFKKATNAYECLVQEYVKLKGQLAEQPTKERSNDSSPQPRHGSAVRSEGISGAGFRTIEWSVDGINVRIESASNSRTFRNLERAVSVVFRDDRISAAAHREWHELINDCARQAEIDEKSKGQTGRRWNIFGGGK